MLTDDVCCSCLVSQSPSNLQVRKSNVSSVSLFDFLHFALYSNLKFVSCSPIKVLNFESHYNKLQADSHYLLSDEYEVSFQTKSHHGNTNM